MPKIYSTDEALLKLSEGLTHAARHPNIKHYAPHEKQADFHKSDKKGKLYIGGNRSGKTTGGVCEGIWRSTNRHPFRKDLNSIGPTRGRVVAVDFNQGVEKIIFPQYQQWLYPSAIRGGAWESAYDKTLRTLNFANGSTIEFMSYDQDLDKFAGTSRHWIHFDEEAPKSIYTECLARLVDTNGDWWMTMTPVEGMTWVYDDIYENSVNVEDPEFLIVEISTLENPYLNSEAVSRFIKNLDADDRTSRVAGQFVAVGGRIYKSFDPTIGGPHVLSDPLEDPKEYVKKKLVVVSFDHGLNNPACALWHAVDKHGKALTFHEYYHKNRSVKENATEILKINRQLGLTPDLYVADPSIKNRNAITLTSIHEEYIKYGIPFVLGNNDVKSGLVRVKGYLNPSPRFDGKPTWQCTPNCQKLIWEMRRYRWKVYQQKKLQYENNAYEEPQKKDDHACDALRYFLMTRPDLRFEDDFGAVVNEALDKVGLGVSKLPSDVADPFDLGHNPHWTTENSIPNRNGDGGWDYDEHMGGIL